MDGSSLTATRLPLAGRPQAGSPQSRLAACGETQAGPTQGSTLFDRRMPVTHSKSSSPVKIKLARERARFPSVPSCKRVFRCWSSVQPIPVASAFSSLSSTTDPRLNHCAETLQ